MVKKYSYDNNNFIKREDPNGKLECDDLGVLYENGLPKYRFSKGKAVLTTAKDFQLFPPHQPTAEEIAKSKNAERVKRYTEETDPRLMEFLREKFSAELPEDLKSDIDKIKREVPL